MRVVLLAHAATPATRAVAFPTPDEPVERPERVDADLPRVAVAVTAPTRRCRTTATLLGLDAAVDPDLVGCDHGAWTGRSLADVGATDPAGLRAWLTDPGARPPGGETAVELTARIAAWLDAREGPASGLLAVVDQAVVRAALVHATGAPVGAAARFDVGPLGLAVLTGSAGDWRVRELRPPGRQ